jgi:uncharacterized MAPEG superfamily protein
MTPDLRILLYSTLLTWVMVMFAATVRNRLWTVRGLIWGAGNRDQPGPEQIAITGRADRAAKNMLENLLFFVALLLTARAAGVPSEDLVLPARIFFYARLAYFPVYVIGIPWLRTVCWAIGVIGMAMIAAEMISH